MFVTLEVLAVSLVSIAMALALAHALEFPVKMRLDKQTYLAVQPIYYPGFTIGGGVGEGGGICGDADSVMAYAFRERGVWLDAGPAHRAPGDARGLLDVYSPAE